MPSFFKKSNDRIALEISPDGVQLLYFKGGRFAREKTIVFSENVRGNEFQEDNLVHLMFEEFKKEAKVEETLPVSLVVEKNSFNLRVAELPSVSEAKLRSLIFWDLATYFNFDTTEIYWDFSVLEDLRNGNSRVLIGAVKKQEWDRISAIVKSSGFALSGLESPISCFQTLFDKTGESQGQVAAVYFSTDSALCCFMVNNVPIFFRELTYNLGDDDSVNRLHEKWDHTQAFFQANFRFFVNKVYLCGRVPENILSTLEQIFGKGVKLISGLPEAGVSEYRLLPLAACALREKPLFPVSRLTAELEMPAKERDRMRLELPRVAEIYVLLGTLILLIASYLSLHFYNVWLSREMVRSSQVCQRYYPLIQKLNEVQVQKEKLAVKEKQLLALSNTKSGVVDLLTELSSRLPATSWISSLNVTSAGNGLKIQFTGSAGDYDSQMNFLESLKSLKNIRELNLDSIRQSNKSGSLWDYSISLRIQEALHE
ncbi:MAG: PilN domain-containing protein [Candidatus Wallbacteria bacterium]|nr:PilN domain-containing protein [Candidatus Wallbacteria bacterium]